ncbi:acetoacetate--CoA ligase [Smaragdicoccus niigatensis]|uniref:acetoacetate--CoA ligase n=1 Tax=Smaragdicoccus niigatensis TaxID=359359 RepID=UPI00036B8427|nr:acetoacetate--CoA ligase [Smaragdicoccus niigatensis]
MEPQWVPTQHDIDDAQITAFSRFVSDAIGWQFVDYAELWRWSVEDVEAFWGLFWSFLGFGFVPTKVLSSAEMPGAQWFPGAELNYVDRIAQLADNDEVAIRAIGEDGKRTELTYRELVAATAAFARTLTELGVGRGDRVVGYLPDIPEAVIAFLATASIGAIWSGCGQDYSASAALDRLGQLDPVVLVAADGYRYGGKVHDKREDIAALRSGLPTLRSAVLVSRLGRSDERWLSWEAATSKSDQLRPTPVPFSHPLWVLFSSGTTGKPKGILHGHGGVVLEHLKALVLQSDVDDSDTFFWFTSPSWMMWNYRNSALLMGATIVCYDGNPGFSRPDALWKLAAETRATVLGTSPAYVLNCIKAGAKPSRDFDLTQLRMVGITGSPLPATSSEWLGENIGDHVQVSSISGGTDVVSAFFGGVTTVPVWPGELSAAFLGTAVEAWDGEGRPVIGEMGELVITKPMPSMPVGFWHDPDGSRYRAAYFEHYPGVWRHGDWITITDRGSIVVHGRSDATLNRGGIRMGVADIYQVVEQVPEVSDALVLGVEQPNGGYWMPLFVVLTDGQDMTEAVKERIAAAIRTELSPRHVPDDIIVAPGIPHTRTGKRLEVPIKRILQGADPEKVVAPSAIDNPELLAWYASVSR